MELKEKLTKSERINKIAKKMVINKFLENEEIITYNGLINRFLLNEDTDYKQKKLLNVIEKVNYYKMSQIKIHLNAKIHRIIASADEDIFVVIKEKLSSSNHNLVVDLNYNGIIKDENMLKVKEIDNRYIIVGKEIDIPKDSIILLLDDYIGSGKTIIKMIYFLEEKYQNCKVKIVAYIWQKNAIYNLQDFLKKHILNNYYELINDNCIIENDYKWKFNNDENTKEYIEEICGKCKAKSYKFGRYRSGAMLAIDNISPNNNISMLWRNDIDYNNWNPIFDRERNILVIKRAIIKNIRSSYQYTRDEWIKFKYCNEIAFTEFKMLLLLFNSYYIEISEIKRLFGIDTEEEVVNILNKFKKLNIISYNENNILEFIDNDVICQFKYIINKLSGDSLNSIKKK